MVDFVRLPLPAKAMQDWADYGEIQDDGSLKVHRFPDAYPVGEYFISRLLKLLLLKAAHPAVVVVGGTAVGDHGTHALDPLSRRCDDGGNRPSRHLLYRVGRYRGSKGDAAAGHRPDQRSRQ